MTNYKRRVMVVNFFTATVVSNTTRSLYILCATVAGRLHKYVVHTTRSRWQHTRRCLAYLPPVATPHRTLLSNRPSCIFITLFFCPCLVARRSSRSPPPLHRALRAVVIYTSRIVVFAGSLIIILILCRYTIVIRTPRSAGMIVAQKRFATVEIKSVERQTGIMNSIYDLRYDVAVVVCRGNPIYLFSQIHYT